MKTEKKCSACGQGKRLYKGICPECRKAGRQAGRQAVIPHPAVALRSKTWLDVQIEEAVARVLALAKENGSRKFTLELEIEMSVKEVKVKQ